MTDPQPKRRGRPPGSKNRTQTQRAIELTGISYLEPISTAIPPAIVESWTAGPIGVRVLVRFKAGLSTEPIEETLDWPHGWPIPQLNDVIRVPGLAGRVQFVEYDYEGQVIIITAT